MLPSRIRSRPLQFMYPKRDKLPCEKPTSASMLTRCRSFQVASGSGAPCCCAVILAASKAVESLVVATCQHAPGMWALSSLQLVPSTAVDSNCLPDVRHTLDPCKGFKSLTPPLYSQIIELTEAICQPQPYVSGTQPRCQPSRGNRPRALRRSLDAHLAWYVQKSLVLIAHA